MNIKNRLLLLLLVLTLVVTPLCSCDAILNLLPQILPQESTSVTETNIPKETTPEETTSSQTTLEETSPETPDETEDYKTKYADMSPEEFYADYELAENAEDAYWRSYYGFMSGSLTTPDQAPTVAENRPMQDGMYIRNSVTTFIGDDVYVLVDVNGDVVMEISKSKFDAIYGDCVIAGARVLVVKPQTYMNLSGNAVQKLSAFYKIPADRVIVLHDEISFEPGIMRIRRKGSAGGHNGIKSIIAELGSEAFPRVKIGVGAKANPQQDLADWVLSTYRLAEERDAMEKTFVKAADVVEDWLKNGIDHAMQEFNKFTPAK